MTPDDQPKRTGMASFDLVLLVAALLMLFGGQIFINLRLQAEAVQVRQKITDETQFRLNPKLAKIMSFQNVASLIDLLWIRALQDDQITTRAVWEKGHHPSLFYSLDLLTDLDDLNYMAFTSGSRLLTVVRNDNEGALQILTKGREAQKTTVAGLPQSIKERIWANEWEIPLLIGYVYLFELKDLPSASSYLSEASQLPGAPFYLRQMGERLKKKDGVYEVGLRLLDFQLKLAKDDSSREELEKKRDSVLLSRYLFQQSLDFKDYLEKNRLPFKPPFEDLWKRYIHERNLTGNDPEGGLLSVDSNGKVQTTTPYEKVLGLE
jgi:hypothetical protein